MHVQQRNFSITETTYNEVLSTPQKNASSKDNTTDFFDNFSTPKKNFPVKTKHGIKHIAVQVSASAKKTKHALYRFKRKSDGKSYIGFSTDVCKRLSGHLSSCRHPEKDAGKGALQKAIQENAKKSHKGKAKEDFTFGIILKKEDLPQGLQHLSMGEIEKLYIDHKKSKGASLFNKRGGGGGGHGRGKQAGVKATAQEVDAFVKQMHKTYKSPTKSYPINPDTLSVEFTPSAINSKNYVFKRVRNETDSPSKLVAERYIGKTERATITPRMAEHSSHARHSEKEIGKKPLYSDIRNHPKQFCVQVIDTSQFETDDPDLIEQGLIKYYQEKKEPLYNKNNGGGGGHINSKGLKC